jgi:hypothetical protein
MRFITVASALAFTAMLGMGQAEARGCLKGPSSAVLPDIWSGTGWLVPQWVAPSGIITPAAPHA